MIVSFRISFVLTLVVLFTAINADSKADQHFIVFFLAYVFVDFSRNSVS